MAKLKVENQRRQKVLTVYRMELLSHFFLAVVDTFKVECVYSVYTHVHLWCPIKGFTREVASLILCCIEHHDTRHGRSSAKY